MNVYTWTIGASHTPAALLAVAGTGLPFDLTDMVASFLFGLAFGPELARLLARMRARMDIQWDPALPKPAVPRREVVGATTSASRSFALLARSPQTLRRRRHGRARVQRVRSRRARRVAVPGALLPDLRPELRRRLRRPQAGSGSSELYTAWAAMGLAAAGRNPASVRRGGHSVLDSLRAEVSTLNGLGDAERTILAARACGASSYSFAGRNLVAEVLQCARQRRLLRASRQPHRVRDLRAARRRSFAGLPRDPRRGGLDRAPAELRRRLRLRRARLVQRRRRHRRGAAGARGRRRAQRGVLGAAADYLIRSQNLDGGYPQQLRQRIQRPVDRLGGPGPDRGRAQPQHGAPPRQPLADRLPGKPAHPRRQHPLLPHRRPDARLGDRPGADRARGQDVPRRAVTQPPSSGHPVPSGRDPVAHRGAARPASASGRV